MAQNKKASEGIALLSMYGDDEDDEMEEFEGEGEQEEGQASATASGMLVDSEDLAVTNEDPQGKVHVQIPGDQTDHPQFAESNGEAEADINISPSAMAEDSAIATTEQSKDIDLLRKFLPPPPKTKCSDELQHKIFKFIQLKKQKGRSFNAEVRNRKDYRNPDFLRHAVTYQDIDEIGSCFSKDVFDPHGYDNSDFYDELEADMRRELERKEQERKRSPKVEFYSGGTQIGVPTPKINLPIPAIPGSGFNTTASAVDATTRDSRQNKKSKWDKVDSVSSQAAPLSSNSGSGYSAYAEHRRREAEDKRSSDRKSDRRS